MTSTGGRRRDLDGLHALAVVPVVIYHVDPAAMPGGFAGVDVIFVLSGYLITGVIAGALDRGDFSLADFYRRRVRRLAPARVLVLATTLAVGATGSSATTDPPDHLACASSPSIAGAMRRTKSIEPFSVK